MNTGLQEGRGLIAAAVLMAATVAGAGTAIAAADDDAVLYVEVPGAWRGRRSAGSISARRYPGECATIPSTPRDVVLTAESLPGSRAASTTG